MELILPIREKASVIVDKTCFKGLQLSERLFQVVLLESLGDFGSAPFSIHSILYFHPFWRLKSCSSVCSVFIEPSIFHAAYSCTLFQPLMQKRSAPMPA